MQQLDQQIRDLVPAIWETVLSLPLQYQEEIPGAKERTISACIHIAGAWNGAVAVSCDAAFAAQAAVIMFGLEDGLPSTTDMQDALGELTNMVGGNIKALLPEPCHLSLPSAVEGTNYSVRILHSTLVAQVPFRSGLHSMSVSLLEREKIL